MSRPLRRQKSLPEPSCPRGGRRGREGQSGERTEMEQPEGWREGGGREPGAGRAQCGSLISELGRLP